MGGEEGDIKRGVTKLNRNTGNTCGKEKKKLAKTGQGGQTSL